MDLRFKYTSRGGNKLHRFILTTVCAGLVALSPRYDFADSKPSKVSWTPPKSYNMGDAVIVPALEGVKSIWLGARPMTYVPTKKVWLGVAPFGNVGLVFHLGKRATAEMVIPVHAPPIKSASDLHIPKKVWQKVMDGQEEQRAQDRKILRKVLNEFKGTLRTVCWKPPVRGSVTSKFASPRRLQDGQTYHHSGQDHRAAVGTNVRAMGDGRVVYAGEMVLPGINVVLAHGEGWFSRYLHFSALKVGTGAHVKAGQVIGLSGASGRVEAPHLHWEILWRGIPANPASFLLSWARLCDQG